MAMASFGKDLARKFASIGRKGKKKNGAPEVFSNYLTQTSKLPREKQEEIFFLCKELDKKWKVRKREENKSPIEGEVGDRIMEKYDLQKNVSLGGGIKEKEVKIKNELAKFI